MARIGIIGGSGLYALEGIEGIEERRLQTPFGEPSDAYIVGHLGGRELAFLPRHGRGHRILPHEVNTRANVYGFKELDCTHLLSVSAVGSMREEIVPGHLVVPDQLFDRTRARPSTFFGEGIAAHVMFADPYCARLRGQLLEAARAAGATAHDGGTYLCIDGPQFSTRGESLIFRQWGVSVIGMTALPEARLAREAELCYATLALATDYDCWHQGHDDVSVEAVLEIIRKNVALSQRVLAGVVSRIDPAATRDCPCASALRQAIMTAPEHIGPAQRRKLGLLLPR